MLNDFVSKLYSTLKHFSCCVCMLLYNSNTLIETKGEFWVFYLQVGFFKRKKRDEMLQMQRKEKQKQ